MTVTTVYALVFVLTSVCVHKCLTSVSVHKCKLFERIYDRW